MPQAAPKGKADDVAKLNGRNLDVATIYQRADATDDAAVARIYAAKGRPAFKVRKMRCTELAEGLKLARSNRMHPKIALIAEGFASQQVT